MKIRRITNQNLKYFRPLLTGGRLKGRHNVIRLGMLTDEDVIAGAIQAKIYEKTADIISLYIYPRFRKQGCGSALLKVISGLVKAQGFEAVTGEFLDAPAAVSFARSLGFELFPGRNQYYFSLKEYYRSPLYKKFVEGREKSRMKTVSSLSSREQAIFRSFIKYGDYDPEWSTAHIEKGRVLSCMMVKPEGNCISVPFLYSKSSDRMEFLNHIRSLSGKVSGRVSNRDVIVRMTFQQDKYEQSFTRLIGGKEHMHKDGQYMTAVKLLQE